MTVNLADSGGQRDFLLGHGVSTPESLKVLLNGSISGVDSDTFKPDSKSRAQCRKELGIPSKALVAVFLGRMNEDKGVLDLGTALSGLEPSLHMLWVGPDEEGLTDFLNPVRDRYGPTIHHFIGPTSHPNYFLSAGDFLILPSHREGFGTSVIEAASSGLPSIVTNIYGLRDSIIDGITGIAVEPRNVSQLQSAIDLLSHSVPIRTRMGTAARERAVKEFSAYDLTEAFYDFIVLQHAEMHNGVRASLVSRTRSRLKPDGSHST